MSSSEDSEPIQDSSSEEEQEEQHGGDQQLTGATADPQVLQYFWDLASLEQDARQTAASSLVQALVDSQKQHESSHMPAGAQPGGSLDTQQEGGNRQQRMEQCFNCCSPLMAYGLKRLARGLASSRQGARQGFAAALAATLAHSAAAAAGGHKGGAKGAAGVSTPLQLPFVSAAGVLALLDACLEVTGSMKGSDQRDALLGRVFGLAALCRSGLPAALPAAPAGSISALRGTAVVAEQLLGLLQRKAFLRESAAAALVELLGGLSTADMQQVLSQAPKLTSLLQVQPNSATPESLYIALRLWHNLPQQQLQSCQLLPKLPANSAPPPELFWQQPGAVQRSSVAAAAAALFAAGQLKALCPALLATTASHPRMHPVWGCMLALLVPGFVPVKVLQQQPDTEQDQQQQQQQHHIRAAPDQQQLANLWHHFVEASCLNSSHERKALALQLLQLLLPVLTPEAVPVLLSRQLLGCISTALRNKDSYLHASARKSMDRIRSCAEHSLMAKSDPALAAKLRLALAAQLQSANLQQAAAAAGGSKAKGQQGLLQGLDAPGVAAYVDQLLQEFVAALAQNKAAANGSAAAAAAAADSSEDEDMADAEAEADDTKAKQLLDQLAAALKLQAADAATLRKGLVSSSDAAKGGGVLVPTAPLREACEAVFRAFAEEMTPQGLSDMLRLLGQRASEAIKKDDEEDSEVEMDEDDDAGGSDASEDADAEGSGSADYAEQEKDASEDEDAAAPAAAKQPAAAAAADGEDEDEDESDGGMDDEAMMRLDAQLGAAVRSMVAGRGGSAKERAASLLGLQLRVAALLEEWLKKCPKSPLVLQAVLPLLRALVSASGAGGNPTLADRLASIASKQLSKCRPVLLLAGQDAPPPPQQQQPKMELAVFAADLRKVLYYASREKDGRVAAAAGQALLVLIGAGSEAGGAAAAAAQGAAADALQDFFDKKKSRLHKGWCEQLLSRCFDAVLGGEAAGLAAILAACSKGRNESTRGKAAALLPVLLRASQGAAGSADANPSLLLGALQQHQPALAAALGAAVAGPYKGKEQHAAAVKSVVALLAGVARLGSGKRMAELLGAEAVRELGKVVVVVTAAGVQPRVESQLDRLVDVAGLQQLVAAGKPDPARLALLNKQRAALVGTPAAAAAAAGSKRPQPAAAAAAAPGGESSGDEDEEGAREVQPKKKQKSKQQQQQQQQGGGKGKEHKKEKKPAAAAAAAAATGKRKEQDDSESKGKKKKHKQQQ
ncbi:hypothetical protein OEZ85_009542 [Tetradesmus obliquus]|uniref:DNA polymerase V n=1 Tax=Tetradesmus obliquus TaxID=3088 RepID=A0ABY8UD88_TETOB|nr:hypothetical protein OEZ85_009542 [Tetradesmus obliquus]